MWKISVVCSIWPIEWLILGFVVRYLDAQRDLFAETVFIGVQAPMIAQRRRLLKKILFFADTLLSAVAPRLSFRPARSPFDNGSLLRLWHHSGQLGVQQFTRRRTFFI